MDLTEVEKDFIEFMSLKQGRDILPDYLATKREFDFGSKEFKSLANSNYRALRVFFSDTNEVSAVDSYQYFAYQDILRMLSYSFYRPPTVMGYIRTFFKKLRKRDMQRTKVMNLPEKLLSDKISPTIVDYGCGLGYLSFELAGLSPNSKIILVDIDSIKLEFALYRFRKQRYNFESIVVTKDIPYPNLPQHDICIAQEVMEHLHNPLAAYKHIFENMRPGGYLYGDFSDHRDEPFHVSTNLKKLREAIHKDCLQIDRDLYQKKNV